MILAHDHCEQIDLKHLTKADINAVFLAVGEAVILLHPPPPLVGVSMRMERGCQQNGGLADG